LWALTLNGLCQLCAPHLNLFVGLKSQSDESVLCFVVLCCVVLLVFAVLCAFTCPVGPCPVDWLVPVDDDDDNCPVLGLSTYYHLYII
jgi:hypothetical protein